MQNFRVLRVYQHAYSLTLEVYRHTKQFPQAERYGLVAQVRRAAVSITANIAEGCGRMTRKDFIRFLSFARGSAGELETELALSADLGFLPKPDHVRLESAAIGVQRELGALIRRLARSGQ
ncbi:MAG TPA: four helix bundle protein [Gemmatimonadales bacterium]|nr:four helix bundle protein [Gemmatimonadales bacterium]